MITPIQYSFNKNWQNVSIQ